MIIGILASIFEKVTCKISEWIVNFWCNRKS